MGFSHYICDSDDPFASNLPSFLPDGTTCNVFLTGGLPVMLGKAPAPVEVYNDLDSAVLYFFESLRSPNRRGVIKKLLSHLRSFKSYDSVKLMAGYRDNQLQNADRVTLWYAAARTILSRHLQVVESRKLFRRVGEYEVFKRNPKSAFFYGELQDVDNILPEVHGRLYRMQIEHYPLEKVVQIYDSDSTCFVVDLDHLSSVDDRKPKQVISMLQQAEGKYFAFSLSEAKSFEG